MRVNFDANASIKPIPEVLECLSGYSGEFLNPSSVHSYGQAAKRVLDDARNSVAELLGLKKNEKIIFTSGATEANNAALRPSFPASKGSNPDFACSSVEHSAVLEFLRRQENSGYQLKEIPPGEIEKADRLADYLSEDLRGFAIMAANNETGQIFDVRKVAREVREISPRVKIHCDAVQAIGKIHLNFLELGIDTLAISGHKLGALSGVGALIAAEHCQLEPWLLGGPQESGLRAGTENVLAIKTFAIACRAAKRRLDVADSSMLKAKELITAYLHSLGEFAQINSFGKEQLPNTISVRFPGIKADDLVVALDLAAVAVSAGSACTSGRPSPSHVLLAHGLTAVQAKETLRISFEPDISIEELEFGLSALRETITRMIDLRRAA